MPANTTIVSAPGKVLLAGGYLVLDPAFSGLVVATDARFYTLIKPSNLSTEAPPYSITVRSPQFENATWTYLVDVNDKDVQLSPSATNASRNTFVELALAYSLAMLGHLIPGEYVTRTLKSGLEIIIAGNNDFYSQRKELESRGLPLNTDSLRQIPLFAPTHTTLGKVHKTGLGSSAALITSLVSAMFVHFNAADLTKQDATATAFLHNTAQFVHCLAQGKVGSGFDVSSAVWGSHTYTRFNPELLQDIMHNEAKNQIISLLKVLDPTQTTWDNKVAPFRLAPQLHLMLADIDAGSHTPTLVSNVLKWRKTKPEEANRLWALLGKANDKVVELLKRLDQSSRVSPAQYNDVIRKAGTVTAKEWKTLLTQTAGEEEEEKEKKDETTTLLIQIYDEFQTVRQYLRQMSQLSRVPVEPEEQTRLLDACLAVPGVLMAGVPGGPLLCTESVEGGLVVELYKDAEPASERANFTVVKRLLDL
ncbi:phosphomevalonate kinase [Podila humilis]|nr:phosphomevalonate kinase [Podila humilis]